MSTTVRDSSSRPKPNSSTAAHAITSEATWGERVKVRGISCARTRQVQLDAGRHAGGDRHGHGAALDVVVRRPPGAAATLVSPATATDAVASMPS